MSGLARPPLGTECADGARVRLADEATTVCPYCGHAHVIASGLPESVHWPCTTCRMQVRINALTERLDRLTDDGR